MSLAVCFPLPSSLHNKRHEVAARRNRNLSPTLFCSSSEGFSKKFSTPTASTLGFRRESPGQDLFQIVTCFGEHSLQSVHMVLVQIEAFDHASFRNMDQDKSQKPAFHTLASTAGCVMVENQSGRQHRNAHAPPYSAGTCLQLHVCSARLSLPRFVIAADSAGVSTCFSQLCSQLPSSVLSFCERASRHCITSVGEFDEIAGGVVFFFLRETVTSFRPAVCDDKKSHHNASRKRMCFEFARNKNHRECR